MLCLRSSVIRASALQADGLDSIPSGEIALFHLFYEWPSARLFNILNIIFNLLIMG